MATEVPDGMRVVGEVDFIDAAATQGELVRVSLAVLGVGAAAVALAVLCGALPAGEVARVGAPWWLMAVGAASVVTLPVHELVHGALFRLMGGPGTRVRFGAAQGMIFASCPGLVLPRRRFCAVLAGPAVLVTALAAVAPAAAGMPLLGLACAVIHLSGCSGDLVALAWALSARGCTHCQDTPTGVRMLAVA